MGIRTPQIGKLKCNNRKCGRVFDVVDFRPNTAIRCPYCRKSSQYRTIDYIRENYPKNDFPT